MSGLDNTVIVINASETLVWREIGQAAFQPVHLLPSSLNASLK